MQHQTVFGLERYECTQWVDTVYRGLHFILPFMDMNIPIYFLTDSQSQNMHLPVKKHLPSSCSQ